MNIFLITFLEVIFYMVNPYIAFALSVFMYGKVILQKNQNFSEKILTCLVLSSPFYCISILGNKLHHALSWTTIFLFIFMIYFFYMLLKTKNFKHRNVFLLAIISLLILFIRNIIFTDDIKLGIINYLQVASMIIPIFLTYVFKDDKTIKIKKSTDDWLRIINYIVLALAFGVIVQFLADKLFIIQLGKITLLRARIIYDLYFNAFSELSIFLGFGIIINYLKILDKFKLYNLFEIILYLIAITINTSRTGLFSSILVCIIITIIKLKNKKNINIKKMFAILMFFIITLTITLYVLSTYRGDVNSIFSNNGRLLTWKNAIVTILSSSINFFFGIGLNVANYPYILPHNFIIETWLSMGIFMDLILLFTLYKILIFIKDNKIKYLIWHILISSMAITGFHESSYITIFIVLSLLINSKVHNVDTFNKTLKS